MTFTVKLPESLLGKKHEVIHEAYLQHNSDIISSKQSDSVFDPTYW